LERIIYSTGSEETKRGRWRCVATKYWVEAPSNHWAAGYLQSYPTSCTYRQPAASSLETAVPQGRQFGTNGKIAIFISTSMSSYVLPTYRADSYIDLAM
jgi:hypothetical protein